MKPKNESNDIKETKTTYTPGPWTATTKDGVTKVSAKNRNLAVCTCWNENEEANARLIAAAPQLVEALKGIKKAIEEHTEILDIVEHFIEWREVEAAVRAAGVEI